MERPLNILLILTDQQQQRLLGAYGSSMIATPNLDGLARRGVLFANAITAQPVCTASRASLLTGTYGHTHGCVTNNATLTPDLPSYGEIFGEHGYTCGYLGKWHLGNEVVPQRGFEAWYRSTEDKYMSDADRAAGRYSSYHTFLTEQGRTPAMGGPTPRFTEMEVAGFPEEHGKPAFLTAEANAFLERHGHSPFILTVSFVEPHPPYFGPFDGLIDPAGLPLPPNYRVDAAEMAGWSRRTRRFRDFYHDIGHNIRSGDPADLLANFARYLGLIAQVDKAVGQLLDLLEAHGVGDDTLVLFTSDHGDMMGSHQIVDKGMMFEESLKVPLLLSHPREPLGPQVFEPVVNNIDLLPTLLDFAGLAAPDHLQGVSVAPALRGEAEGPQFAVSEWNGKLQNMHARQPLFADVLDLHLRCVVTPRSKLIVSSDDTPEFYDLELDPLEQRNRVDDPGCAAVVEELYQDLLVWQRRHDDALHFPHPLQGRTEADRR